MSEWKSVFLTDVSVKIGDGLHGTPTYDESGDYYFINGNNLLNGRVFIKPETKKITKAEFDKIKKDLNSSTLLLSINGTIGNVSKYAGENCALGKSVCYINLDKNIILRDYFYYECLSDNFQSYLDNIATGTTIPNVPLKGLRSYEFKIPPITEQKSISSVLSSLEDKIDLLHRQNKTLEAMAETLFRQWFDNEQQDNLKEGKLSDILSLKYGKALKQENRSGEGFPVVASGGIVGFHNEYLVNAPGIVIGRKGTLGKVYYMYENFYPIDTSYYIESKIKNSKLYYEYFLLKSLGFENMNSDSAVPGLNRDSAMSSPITLPSFEMIVNFNSFCEEFFKKIKINLTQTKTLENLRDTLLPKLMSGEVRVQYAEEAIASVA